MPSQPSKELQTFPNPKPERDYEIAFDVPEFTCLCPLTGQPDFATFKIRYVPDALCVELKSLKLYMWAYRNEGAFHEKVTNTIADDIIRAINPRKLVVEGNFFVRGGIGTLVTVTHEKSK
jgi:7-cyano-7-deazaguanine reductase